MTGFSTLPRSFFERSAEAVAPELLGTWLVRHTPGGLIGGQIVETEAYVTDDPACHAAPGPTERNRVMFGPAGHCYVYFIYGCHYCVNVVCMPPGIGEAVLIRAIEPKVGLEIMQKNRPVAVPHLTNGPGKLCAAMKVTRVLNGVDMCSIASPLRIMSGTERIKAPDDIITTTRIGITKAASLPLRFYCKESSYVSRKA